MSKFLGRHALHEMTRDLTLAAQGKLKADSVIKGGLVVNVFTKEIFTADVSIYKGRIVLVGKADHTIGPNTNIIDASGFYLTPGLLDGHMHVESSMVTVTQFARAALPCGTTTIFMDPHEIANVLGLRGVKLMVDEGKNLPLKVFATMPSCVPSAPGFEDAGAIITPREIAEAMKWEEIIGLGEMMNFPGVLAGDENVHEMLKITMQSGKVVTGHYSIPETEVGLQAYAASGVASCHEGTRKEDALARMRLGMYNKMREGSAWQDIKATIKSLTETFVDDRRALLVTDDTHPHTILTLGHMNHVVKRTIEEGMNPISAIQMATINTAECFRVSHEIGAIAPGRCADILFLRDLADFNPEIVMTDGEIVAREGKLTTELKALNYPDWALNSVRIKGELSASDFEVKYGGPEKEVTIRVIQVVEARVNTFHKTAKLKVHDQRIEADLSQDLAKVAVVERHGGPGNMGIGFVGGFGLKRGAVASTVAHDSHNLLIMGTNDADMAFAGNVLHKCGGGMVAVCDGKVLALVELPIAGLMSDKPVEEVDAHVKALDEAWHKLGCTMESPFMTMALLSLPVIPELRITNRGLVDTLNFKFVDLIV
jgi:adenine deaminase